MVGSQNKLRLCRLFPVFSIIHWIGPSKFDEFCKRKSDKRRILRCAMFEDFICVHHSAELDGYHNCRNLSVIFR